MIPAPQRIILHEISRQLEVIFVEDPTQAVERSFRFSCEFLRVYSPSAELQQFLEGLFVFNDEEVGGHGKITPLYLLIRDLCTAELL